ncbi:hypothetical protein LCGC14_2365920 [marine sediment metagenome]|uniref:DUF3307 domain-containing protein n=1 Tax=marine sediment metagenome TaxID=412755 RepID=A0A0F9C553_9ZZZZ
MSPELILLTFFVVKHFVCDFPLQTVWMATNKGTYGHRGGLAHVGVHALGTFFILTVFSQTTEIFFSSGPFLMILLFEAVVHYHMDWFKMWFNKRKCWTCDKSSEFWNLMGFDQLVHYLTYVFMVWYLL